MHEGLAPQFGKPPANSVGLPPNSAGSLTNVDMHSSSSVMDLCRSVEAQQCYENMYEQNILPIDHGDGFWHNYY